MQQPAQTSVLTTRSDLFQPPAPEPLKRPPDLFGFLKAVRINPLTSWTREHFEEPMVASRGLLGRMTIVNDPAAIRHILGQGLLTAEGEDWKLQRRALAPLFNPRTVTSFVPAMVDASERLLRRWRRRPQGRVLDISLEMTRVTLDVLERTIFTHGLARDPDALGRAITRYFDALGPIDPLDIFGMPNWVPRVGRMRAQPAIRFFGEVVGELIGARRALLERGEPAPHDLLTLLIGASDPETGRGLTDLEVQANIVTFIGAGHETTANALSWSLYLISQAPGIRERLEQEADAVLGEGPLVAGRLDQLVYTRAVIEEAMRLYPPVPFTSRAAIRTDRIGNYRIPAASIVTIAPWVLHRHRKLWRDPDHFDPSRFLPENRGSIDRFAYLPFGAGPRVCIGASFSLQEAVIVLASVMREARLDLVPDWEVMPVQRVTLRPSGGMPMQLSLRDKVGPVEVAA